ncbi:MAG: biotin--[acetyl-CoA-carboxylase] ligase [Bacteroidetes bacterium]|nr:biotin--[acetyl-CoA-carboxylase] ligase [Bacteroidota bacterium]
MLFIGNEVIELKEIDSTNDYALKALESSEIPEGTVIMADYQFKGKGQQGGFWESEPFKNLTLSLVLYPKFLPLDKQFYLNMAVSLAIYDLCANISEATRAEIKIKWPNDILINNKKIAGTLIENSIAGNIFKHSVIGIGVNVNQTKFNHHSDGPISFKLLTNREYDLGKCRTTLFEALEKRYFQLRNNNLEEIYNEYLEHLYLFGEKKNFSIGEQIITGKITGVTQAGNLELSSSDGLIELKSKDIKFLD